MRTACPQGQYSLHNVACVFFCKLIEASLTTSMFMKYETDIWYTSHDHYQFFDIFLSVKEHFQKETMAKRKAKLLAFLLVISRQIITTLSCFTQFS